MRAFAFRLHEGLLARCRLTVIFAQHAVTFVSLRFLPSVTGRYSVCEESRLATGMGGKPKLPCKTMRPPFSVSTVRNQQFSREDDAIAMIPMSPDEWGSDLQLYLAKPWDAYADLLYVLNKKVPSGFAREPPGRPPYPPVHPPLSTTASLAAPDPCLKSVEDITTCEKFRMMQRSGGVWFHANLVSPSEELFRKTALGVVGSDTAFKCLELAKVNTAITFGLVVMRT
uniref:Uncharacterized protein n=1 Tax=Sphaerodactylus townsendi TaxID=933632 RepID=A0ACB8E8V5_9SAUR